MTDQPAPNDQPAANDRPDDDRLRYRLLTGPDDHEFCARVSRALDDGYVLHGAPGIAVGPDGPVVCQAIVLP